MAWQKKKVSEKDDVGNRIGGMISGGGHIARE